MNKNWPGFQDYVPPSSLLVSKEHPYLSRMRPDEGGYAILISFQATDKYTTCSLGRTVLKALNVTNLCAAGETWQHQYLPTTKMLTRLTIDLSYGCISGIISIVNNSNLNSNNLANTKGLQYV
eukprot:6382100-Ditylum_brightwellii.AAC.1